MNRSIITSPDQFDQWISQFWRPIMSFDTETTGLINPEMACIGFSLCNGSEVCYVDLLAWQGRPLEGPTIENLLQPLPRLPFGGGSSILRLNLIQQMHSESLGLTDEAFLPKLIMHNAPFDMAVLEKCFGIRDGYFSICTLTGAKLVDGNRDWDGAYSLKTLAADWLNINPNEIIRYNEASKLKGTPEFAKYGMNDAEWTWKLWEYEKPKIAESGQNKVFFEIECPFNYVLKDMELGGVLVNQPYLCELEQKVGKALIDLQKQMCKSIGLKTLTLFGEDDEIIPINFNSTQQVVNVIEGLGFEIIEKSKKTKSKSVTDKTLKRLTGKHEFIDLLAEYKHLRQLNSLFVKKIPKHIQSDGCLRPSYHLIKSGRITCSDPNMQQFPNPKKQIDKYGIRKVIIARPGHVFVKGDYSGQELVVLAQVTKDRRMLNAFKNNQDLHLVTANDVFSLNLSGQALTDGTTEHSEAVQKFAKERDIGKNGLNFPIVYGSSEKSIAERYGYSIHTVRHWLEKFWLLYPDAKFYIEGFKRRFHSMEHPSCKTLMGRLRVFSAYHSQRKWEKESDQRAGFNHLIQGFSADMAKIAAYKIWKRGWKIVMAVHDELIVECKKEDAERCSQDMKDCMEHAVSMLIPIRVDIKIVSNYYGDK